MADGTDEKDVIIPPKDGGVKDEKDEKGANDKKEGDDLTKQLETERARAIGLDKKVSELNDIIKGFTKEKEDKETANKTEKEKLTIYEQKIKTFEQKEAFRKAFTGENLDAENFYDIVNEQDADKQAKKFAELLKKEKEASALKAVEDFKKEELSKVPSEPKPKDKDDITKNKTVVQKPWNRHKS